MTAGDVRVLPAGLILHVQVEGWDPRRVNTGRRHVIHVDRYGIVTPQCPPGAGLEEAEGDLAEAGLVERRPSEPGLTALYLTAGAEHMLSDSFGALARSRGWRDWLGAVTVRGTFPSVEAFYADLPIRERSPEVDFGVMWRDGDRAWPQYRISWVEATGEVYAVAQRVAALAPVEVLGIASSREDVEARLAGWADQGECALDWARARLASAPAGMIAP